MNGVLRNAFAARRWRPPGALGLGLLLAVGCFDDTAQAGDAEATAAALQARGLLVVAGDYQSTALSRVDLDRELVVAPAFLHSGSALSGSGSALSGDVVAGRMAAGCACPEHAALVLDRGRGVVTRLRGLEVVGQLDVAGGFRSNPQDALGFDDEVWVARGEREPVGGAAIGPLGGGDDVLVVGHDAKVRARLALSGLSTLGGGTAMAGSGAYDGDGWWLPLASISPDFQSVGPGRVVAIAREGAEATSTGGQGPTHALRVAATLDLPTLRNCRAARIATPSTPRLVVACSGPFSADLPTQVAQSGLAVFALDATGQAHGAPLVLPASALGGRHVGFALDVEAAQPVAWFVSTGAVAAAGGAVVADRLFRVDLVTQEASQRHLAAGAFSLGGLHVDAVRGRIWVVDHADLAGDLWILPLAGVDGQARRLRTSAGGLRALELGPW